MKTKDTIVFNNKLTLNPVLATRAWFWHVASLISVQRLIIQKTIIMRKHTQKKSQNTSQLKINNFLYFLKRMPITAFLCLGDM